MKKSKVYIITSESYEKKIMYLTVWMQWVFDEDQAIEFTNHEEAILTAENFNGQVITKPKDD